MVQDASAPPAFGLSFVGLSWHRSLERVEVVRDADRSRAKDEAPAFVALCGTRPVRRLALLMAGLGPVPTVEEVRGMIKGREEALALWRQRRVAKGLPPEPTAAELAAQRERALAYFREYERTQRRARNRRRAA